MLLKKVVLSVAAMAVLMFGANAGFAQMPSGNQPNGMINDNMQKAMVSMKDGRIMDGMVQLDTTKSMMLGILLSDGSYSERAYLSAMIPHHEMAIIMANDVLKNGKNSEVKKWAESVIKIQTNEIKDMKAMLIKLGGEDLAASKAMNEAMSGMVSPKGVNADKYFVTGMIEHHASAVEMSVSAVVASKDEKIVKLANEIIKGQLKEIAEYKEWLAKNK